MAPPCSGVAMGWAGWAKSREAQSTGGPSSGQKIKNNFPVLEKIRTSGYQTLECFIATLSTDMQISEGTRPPNAFLCELHKNNAFGGQAPPGPTAGAIALPRPPSPYKGEGGKGKEKVGNKEGWEGKDVKG